MFTNYKLQRRREIRTVDDGDQYSAGLHAEIKTTTIEPRVGSPDVVLDQFTPQQVATVVGRSLVDRVRCVIEARVDRLVAQIIVGHVDRNTATCFRLGPDDHFVDRGGRHSLLADEVQRVARPQVQLRRARLHYTAYTQHSRFTMDRCIIFKMAAGRHLGFCRK